VTTQVLPGAGDPLGLIGRQLGNYRVSVLLGAGGMGAVYLGDHTEIGGQRVAIKVLLPELAASADVAGRFIAEAQACAAIRHRNIVRLLDFGRIGGVTPYLVFEFLEGMDVQKLIELRGQVPLLEAVAVIAQGALGLQAAHDKGIIHRDVKPQNLFVEESHVDLTHLLAQAPGSVKVLDFGIARVAADAKVRRTVSQSVAGSAGFMSPEQCQGLAKAGVPADVWSLAAVFYFMVTGRHPFPADSLMAYALAVHQSTPMDPRAFRGDLPEGCSYTVLHALAKEVDARPQTVRDLVLRLASDIHGGMDVLHRVAPELLRGGPNTGTVRATPVEVPLIGAAAPQQWSPPHQSGPISTPFSHPGTVYQASASQPSGRHSTGGIVSGALITSPPAPHRTRTIIGVAAVAGVLIAGAAAALVLLPSSSSKDEPAAPVAVAMVDAAPAVDPVPVAHSDAAAELAAATAGLDAGEANSPSGNVPAEPAPPAETPPPESDDRSKPAARSFGQLEVIAVPWASVTIDGVSAGQTPIKRKLPARRRYKVVLSGPRGARAEFTTAVREGRPTVIEHNWGSP
jgi:serine/threonine protein kinase